MIDQAKEVAQRLRDQQKNWTHLHDEAADTIVALVLEVEGLGKQNNTITEAYELEAAECSWYAAEEERLRTKLEQAQADAARMREALEKVQSALELTLHEYDYDETVRAAIDAARAALEHK